MPNTKKARKKKKPAKVLQPKMNQDVVGRSDQQLPPQISPIPAPALKAMSGHAKAAWEWWRGLGAPSYVMSPMVGQSELAFRDLCRQHGTQLCYTPMFISDVFVRDAQYRQKVWQTSATDRPLIVQFCGNDAATLLNAGILVQDKCDAVDLNLGCPQKVAERGNYGSFLMEERYWPLLEKIVSKLANSLSVPVTVKVRVFEDVSRTLRYCKMLERAGASLLTLHPRTRGQREEVLADWEQIRQAKAELQIPVLANGDCWHAEDVWLCLCQTKADGVMCAQGLLHNPALFAPLAAYGAALPSPHPEMAPPLHASLPPHLRHRRSISPFATFSLSSAFKNRTRAARVGAVGQTPFALPPKAGETSKGAQSSSSFFSTAADVHRQFDLAAGYLQCCGADAAMPCHPSVVQRHLFFILFSQFQANVDLYDELPGATTLSQWHDLVSHLRVRADLGAPHPLAQGRLLQRKRTFRRDGTLAPPPWPVGGGGFNVSSNATRKPAKLRSTGAATRVAASFRPHNAAGGHGTGHGGSVKRKANTKAKKKKKKKKGKGKGKGKGKAQGGANGSNAPRAAVAQGDPFVPCVGLW